MLNGRLVILFLALATFCTAAPGADRESVSLPPSPPWPLALRQAMQRVADVEWRLHTAAGRSCPAAGAATGLILDSLDAYAPADRALAQRSLGLSEEVHVAAVAAGSPAQAAGIMPGDAIVTVNGADIAAGAAGPNRQTAALRAMAALASLPANMPATVILRRGDRRIAADLVPQELCSARIFVSTKNDLTAYSDGANVIITARLVDFTRSADELALLAGHELAHVIARDDTAASLGIRRRMERRADLLGADLAACAGYDTIAAAPLWRRWGRTSILDFLPDPTHGAGKERTAAIQRRPAPRSCPVTGAPPL